MTTKDNQMKPEDVVVLRSENGNLPPELRALKGAMDMVFNAVTNAAQQGPQPIVAGVNPDPVGAAPDFNAEVNLHADTVAERFDARAAEAAPRRMDIEEAISKARGWDYNVAWEAFQAFQAKMEAVYEDRLDEEIAQAMKKLDKLLAKAEEPEIDSKWDEDQYLDDPRRL